MTGGAQGGIGEPFSTFAVARRVSEDRHGRVGPIAAGLMTGKLHELAEESNGMLQVNGAVKLTAAQCNVVWNRIQ